ncbi:MAG: flagellar hook assembly protein FlgD [Proteobacteria bacterium]|nr:flagellar hook assembly protein FlgD [Pseudomonadota bacterium]
MSTIGSATSAAPAAANPADSKARIANNFDQFLQLLTMQLKSQNPLDPLDTNQFTQQLVQFASVEQQIKTNDNLSALVLANKTQNLTNALGFVGMRVTANGTKSMFKNGEASWQLNAPRAGKATIVIKDANGNEVHSMTQTLAAGDQTLKWDGRLPNGQTARDGQYSIVVSALDASGQSMTVKSEVSGIVDAVDVTGSVPTLKVGTLEFPMTDVLSIRRQ